MNTRTLLLSLVLITGFGCTGNSERIKPNASSNKVAEANLDLGIEYMRRGEYEEALEKLNRANRADPKYHPIHNAYGLLYHRLGKDELAEEHFRKALNLGGDDPSTRNNYGRFLCQNERFEEAEEQFMKAAENPLYETPAVAVTNAGTCARRSGNLEKAEEYFRRALEIDPGIPAALRQMAQLTYKQENYLSARAYLQRYMENARHSPETLWLGIRIERKLGDEDAESSYGLLLRNNFPDSEEAALYLSSQEQDQ